MSAKLSTPWQTKRLRRPAASVTVLILEEHAGKWRPVVERHSNCCGTDPHDGCVVMQRFVGPDAASRSEAERWARSAEVTTKPRTVQ